MDFGKNKFYLMAKTVLYYAQTIARVSPSHLYNNYIYRIGVFFTVRSVISKQIMRVNNTSFGMQYSVGGIGFDSVSHFFLTFNH